MVSLQDYVGREQSYVKHIFLEQYVERLAHKTASAFPSIVYVDGFAGPWQSANERFEDTSFGIALNALRRAKASWQQKGRGVRMLAFLVERDPAAYKKLEQVPARYPDIAVKTYPADFMSVLPDILKDIPNDSFALFLIDPKGWRIPLCKLTPMLARPKSEVIFNFMFEFINRAANIKDPAIVSGLDELIPFGDWRSRMEAAEANHRDGLTSNQRKGILVEAFGESLRRLENYEYVAETTIFRPVKDRPLYCLFYATRHRKGLEVFRDCQVKALSEQSTTRAKTKIRHAETNSGQGEFFQSLDDMGPAELQEILKNQRAEAEKTMLDLTPITPAATKYDLLWPQVLARHVVKLTDVNKMAARLRDDGQLGFPEWEKGKHVPQGHYKVQRAK